MYIIHMLRGRFRMCEGLMWVRGPYCHLLLAIQTSKKADLLGF